MKNENIMSVERPEIVEDEHLTYLDELRESGATNMFGATPYVQREFGIDADESGKILQYWMDSFSERHND